MTKGWPNFADSRSAASRAIMSVFPPATNGTMMVTGRVGQSDDACDSQDHMAQSANAIARVDGCRRGRGVARRAFVPGSGKIAVARSEVSKWCIGRVSTSR
jgi:hypothetical protein